MVRARWPGLLDDDDLATERTADCVPRQSRSAPGHRRCAARLHGGDQHV